MKKLTTIRGLGTALVTPFNIDYNVDYTCFRKLVRRQIDSGVHFLVPLGTTGETPCLDDLEKMKLLEVCIKEAGGKVPVLAGAGSNNSGKVVQIVKTFESVGVDGFMIVTPYYNKPTQLGLYTHFKDIAGCTDKPIIIYNVPSRTGVNITAETTLRLAEIPNIIGIKEASSDYIQISEIIRNAPMNFSVISGNDIETLSLCATGARGVISVVSNLCPVEMCDFVNALMEENYHLARYIHHRLTPLFNNCFIESNPIPVKAAMADLGLLQNILRPPLYPASENTKTIMSDTIANLNV